MPPFGYRPDRKQSRILRILKNRTYTIIFAALGLVLLYFSFSAKGFISRLHIESELNDKRARVTELERSIQTLEQQRDLVKNDMAAVEHVARETHGMLKPGEIVYRIRSARDSEKK